MKASREFWDKSAPRYAKSPVRDEAVYQEKLAITQEYFRPDSSVLEFGCGTGSTALVHAPHVRQIIATDISQKMLDIAEQKARDAGVENIQFQRGTLNDLSFEKEHFDVILGLNILHLLEDVDATLATVHKLLKPGGVFVSSTALVGDLFFLWRLLIPVMQWVDMAPYVNTLSKKALLSKLTGAGFNIEREWQPNKASIFIVARK